MQLIVPSVGGWLHLFGGFNWRGQLMSLWEKCFKKKLEYFKCCLHL